MKSGNYLRPLLKDLSLMTYTYANLLIFDDVENQNKYQGDPTHNTFINQHQDKRDKVQVFEFDTSCLLSQ